MNADKNTGSGLDIFWLDFVGALGALGGEAVVTLNSSATAPEQFKVK